VKWRKYSLLIPFLLLLSVMLTSLGRISYSATPTTISVSPSMLYAELGEHFTINLTIAYAVDVYGWEVNLTFNPSVLQITNVTVPPDHFLEGRPQGCVGLQKFIYPSCIILGNCILGDYSGFHGSGVLATIEFEVVGSGECLLGIDDEPGVEPWTFVSNSDLVYTSPPYLKTDDGYISNVDQPPTAVFTLSPAMPEVNETITFDASASNDPDGQITRYEWDFGDGNYINETASTTTHAYQTSGTFTVTLIVIDNATATQEMKDAFNTTTVPHTWYELYSSYSTKLNLKAAHDIAVTSASVSPSRVTVGGSVTISATVKNHGIETETFDVIVYYDSNTATTTTVENLAADAEKTLSLTWDTTGVTTGKSYQIKIDASLTGDATPSDNIRSAGSVRVDSPEQPFPMEYIIIGVVVVVGIGVAAFFFLRKGKSSAA